MTRALALILLLSACTPQPTPAVWLTDQGDVVDYTGINTKLKD